MHHCTALRRWRLSLLAEFSRSLRLVTNLLTESEPSWHLPPGNIEDSGQGCKSVDLNGHLGGVDRALHPAADRARRHAPRAPHPEPRLPLLAQAPSVVLDYVKLSVNLEHLCATSWQCAPLLSFGRQIPLRSSLVDRPSQQGGGHNQHQQFASLRVAHAVHA